jgi:sulfide dehydrogenase cytochrome subunit
MHNEDKSVMNKTMTSALAVALSFSALTTVAVASPEQATNSAQSPSATMAAQTCGGCHGTMGQVKGTAFMPLAGMPTSQFVRAMEAFANGSRPSTLMGPLARSFSKEEIQAMAEYFAAVPKFNHTAAK